MDDEELVTTVQAAEIISKNSGKTINNDYVDTLRHRGILKATKKPGYGRINFYRYGDVKDFTVGHAKRGKRYQPDETVKKRSLDMREYRIRRKAEQAAQIGTSDKSDLRKAAA